MLLIGDTAADPYGSRGIGKTRLGLEIAAALADSFAHGVWFADLAPLARSSVVG